jgi:hypothetical protein
MYRTTLPSAEDSERVRDAAVIFQVDSMLLARQTARYRPWACRSLDLMPIHSECVEIGGRLTEQGIDWDIIHIYLEFNQIADALANQAVEDRCAHRCTPGW